ncbi:MAG: fibronectin type III domain-containing protein, partial [Tepidisphaeraceae bacterium]
MSARDKQRKRRVFVHQVQQLLARRRHFELSPLEPRRLLCGEIIHLAGDAAHDEFTAEARTQAQVMAAEAARAGGPDHKETPPVVYGPEGQYGPTPEAQAIASSATTNAAGLPLLHSNPGAFAKFFLDFDGTTLNNNFPAYNTDSDPTTFNATEAANITEMFLRTAEKFAPFNIDFTTEDPGPITARHIGLEMVGSTGGGGGYAYVNSFANGNLYGVTEINQYTGNEIAAEIIIHEAGHVLGLWHQSLYDANGVKLQEYLVGDSLRGPIMGYLYPPQRALWWNGTSSLGSTIPQDDLAILTGENNAFGYRPDDHGNTFNLADPLDVIGRGSIEATGLIETIADTDVFGFFANGGTIDLSVDVYSFGPSLDATLELYQSQDGEPFTLVAAGATASLGESIVFDSIDSAFYRVVVSSAGNYGDIGQYTLQGTVPLGTIVTPAAGGVTATPITAGRVDVGWSDNATAENGYRVERSSDGGASWSVLATVAANATAYSDTSTVAAQTYHYRVVTTSSTGNADPSNIARAETRSGPANSRATTIGFTKATLAWDAAAGAAGYLLERSTDGVNWTRTHAIRGSATSFQVTGLAIDTQYYFRLRTTKDGYSLAGATIDVHTNFLAVPDSPQNFVATTRSAYSNDLTWNDVATEDTYRIERSTDGVNWVLAGNPAKNATSFTDWNWTPDTLFYYRVAGINEAGAGAWGSIASARTEILTIPEAPTNLRSPSYYGTQFDLTWDDNSETESDFIIERLVAGAWEVAGNVGEENYPWWWTGVLDANTSYTYRVRATNAAGQSDPSNELIINTPPPMPANMNVTAAVHTSVSITWNDVAGELTYRVERNFEDYGEYVLLAELPAGSTSFTDTTAAANQWYNYRVVASNGERDSEPAYFSFTTPAGTPAAPATLAATPSISRRAIDLSWQNVQFETGYKIERSLDGVDGWSQIATTTANVTAYRNTGLTTGATYYYRVRANNGAADSAYSPVAGAVAPAIVAPAAPSNLVHVESTDAEITFEWTDNSNNETGFLIEGLLYDPWEGYWYFGQIATVGEGETSYTATGFYAGDTTSFRVRAVNDGGVSAYSNELNTQTIPGPTSIAVAAPSSSQVNVSWNNVAGESGYLVQRSLSGTAGWTTIGAAAAEATTFADTTVSPNIRYYYRVFATSPVGDSPASNVANVLVPTISVPAQPTGLVASGVSTSQINLTWNDVVSETSYKVQRSTDNVSWSQIATTAQNVTTYADNTLSAGTLYYFRVIASNSAGDSAPSASSSALTIPSVPTGLATSVASSSQINLTWSDVTGESAYVIERSTDGGSIWAQAGTTGAGVTSFNDTALTAATAYLYRVRATNASGASANSATASGTTLTLAPTGLVASAASSSQINLSWSNVTGETGYVVERSPNGSTGWAQIATTSVNVVTFSDTSLSGSTTYYYRVRAANAGGNSAPSNTASATTPLAIPSPASN